MKMRYAGIALILGCLCSTSFAQNAPSGEVFGGYSYLNFDTNGLTSSRQAANGWEAAAVFNANRWLGFEGDVAGYYKTYSPGTGAGNLDAHDYSFVGGPRFSYREHSSTSVFGHALFGGDNGNLSFQGFSGSQTSFAVVLGGGIEWRIRPRSSWGIRASADYVLTRHDAIAAQSFTQNNFRASVGVVYMFGGVRERAPRKEEPATPQQSSRCPENSESALLGLAGCATPNGFLVTSVHQGPGASAGIKPGDFVTAIEDRDVHTSSEIDAAIGDKTSVKVSHMIQGAWLAEHQVKIR
jgi:hypothetical protein